VSNGDGTKSFASSSVTCVNSKSIAIQRVDQRLNVEFLWSNERRDRSYHTDKSEIFSENVKKKFRDIVEEISDPPTYGVFGSTDCTVNNLQSYPSDRQFDCLGQFLYPTENYAT
jgi:hypothetical protein